MSKPLRAEHDEVLVHTGQHHDDELSTVFVEELGIPRPEIELGIHGGSNTSQTARMLEALEPLLAEQRPDLVLVYGDTNTTLAAGLAAAQAGVRVAHVEAGMRSFDRAHAGGAQPRPRRPRRRPAAVPVGDGGGEPPRRARGGEDRAGGRRDGRRRAGRAAAGPRARGRRARRPVPARHRAPRRQRRRPRAPREARRPAVRDAVARRAAAAPADPRAARGGGAARARSRRTSTSARRSATSTSPRCSSAPAPSSPTPAACRRRPTSRACSA